MRIPMLVSRVAVVVLALTLAACASAPPAPSDGLAISGRTLGKRVLHVDECISGEHFVFLGAHLVDRSTKTEARLVIDPLNGSTVRVFDSDDMDGASIVLRRKDCKVFQTDLERTGNWNNYVSEVKLNLRLDCRKHGNVVRGAVTQDSCK